jgi:gliding motility-associated-like protein
MAVYAQAQCTAYDGQGNAVNNPQWVSCSGGNFTLFLQSPNNLGYLIIDWGDGSPNTVVNGLVPPNFISHTYTAAIANYNVTIQDTTNNCTINGLVVMEEPVNASIQIPIGGVTQTCAPADLIFTNSSTDVSQNTTFTWDFGDGSPIQTFGPGNAGQTITHNYAQNTVDCVTEVTLTAENFCSFGNPTEASFNPIQIYDIDDAQIAADFTLLCYPDTVVHFDNVTAKNCVPQGNNAQRFEYWNFGNYWGTGGDSIINWQPFDPPARPGYDIAFPGNGTYTIMMADSNQCGADTAFITVQIVPPPTAGITSVVDSACTGDEVIFTNTSVGGNQTLIDLGVGNGFQAMGASLTYIYNTPGLYTVTLVQNITGGTASCTDTATLDIEILPSPVVNINLAPSNGCDTVNASFINSSSGGATFFWDFGNGMTSTAQNPPPVLYTNEGPTTVVLEVTSNNGCTTEDSAVVEVFDTPDVDFGFDNVCEDAPANFFDSTTVGYGGPISQWTWSFGDPGNSTSNLQNPTFTYQDSGVYTITLVAATPHCVDSFSQTITVEPKPSASFIMSDTIGCDPLIVSFTNATTGAASYFWDFGDGTNTTQAAPTHTFNHTNQSDTVYYIEMIATSAFGCTDTLRDSVVVLGNPVSSFTSNATLDCAPLMVDFTNTSDWEVSWNWDFGNTTGSNLENPSTTFQNQTQFISNYAVSLIVTAMNGCTDTSEQMVTVYPEPLYNFSIVPDSGCSPLTVTFPVAVGAVIYDWDFGDGNTSLSPNPTHTYVNNTTNNQTFTTVLIATSPFGCVDTVQGDVTVFPLPDASFTPLVEDGCEPLTVNFTNTSTGGTVYEWDFDNGQTLNTANVGVASTYTNATNDTLFYQPKLTATTPEGCIDSTFSEVRVYRRILASFGVPSPGCHPYQPFVSDSSLNAIDWDWDFGNGQVSNQQNPAALFTNNTNGSLNFDIQLDVASVEGCTDDTIINIVVNPSPTAGLTLNSSPACQNELVTIVNSSTQNTFNYLQYGANAAFTLNNQNTFDTTFFNTGSTNLQFDIRLAVENTFGCKDTAVQSMTVYPEVEAAFSVPTQVCHPFTAQFTDNSTNASSWQWDFDNGLISIQQSPSTTFLNQGAQADTFNVELLVQSPEGCTDDTVVAVEVFPKPFADFEINSSPACHNEDVEITNTSVQNAVNYWRFGNNGGTFVNNAPVIDTAFLNFNSTPNTLNLRLEVENTFGCRDTIIKPMQVFPILEAQFAALNEGCSPFATSFVDQSTGVSLYEWDFGDGNVSFEENPDHTFINQDTQSVVFNVTLMVTSAYGCTDQDSIEVRVYPTPEALFLVSPMTQRFPDALVDIDNATSPGPWSYDWEFGDGDTSSVFQPGVHVYETWGTYTIFLTASSEWCEDTISRTVVIEPPLPIADFDTLVEGCAPVSIQFSNASEYAVSYLWEFGDGATSSAENPFYSYQFPGVYSITLTVTGPGGQTDSKTIANVITVYEQPIANFTFTPSEVDVPMEPVNFINYSQFADGYLWNFGDTNTSVEENPQHNYLQEGIFFPQLIVYNDVGCRDTMLSEVGVRGILTGDMEVPNAFTPNLSGPNGGMYDPLAFDNQVFFPILSGVSTENYTLSIFNRWGELIFETHDVNQGWDGYYKGVLCQQDAYVWKVQGEYVNGRDFTRVGDVTLVR